MHNAQLLTAFDKEVANSFRLITNWLGTLRRSKLHQDFKPGGLFSRYLKDSLAVIYMQHCSKFSLRTVTK